MLKIIQAIRGMNDILPAQTIYWQTVEATLKQILSTHGYQEIRLPIVESTDLFKRSIGEVTDIVEKEMYTFADRNGDSLTLRPEGTAGCVRACLEHGLLHNQEQRLWYTGPMFRYERPQKGRYRQFYHIGAEVFGIATPDVDAELIMITARFWEQLGLRDHIVLNLNSLGSLQARQQYREHLVAYLQKNRDQLDADSQRRLTTNPLRILDSKNPDVQHIIEQAPKLLDHLDDQSQQHFQELRTLLDAVGISYKINSRLVRGLDYYSRTVFEWVTEELGAQGTVCGGGRYDDLVAQLGGRPTPAIGFALGMERLIALYEQTNKALPVADVDVYMVMMGEVAQRYGFQLAQQIRRALPQLRLITHCGGGAFKNQFKRADKSGAQLALIIGEEEVAKKMVSVKYLREEREQEMIAAEKLVEFLEREARCHPVRKPRSMMKE